MEYEAKMLERGKEKKRGGKPREEGEERRKKAKKEGKETAGRANRVEEERK